MNYPTRTRKRRRQVEPKVEAEQPIIPMDMDLAKSIYRDLAKEYHPDVSGRHNAAEHMARINQNMERLKNQPAAHLGFVLDNSGSMMSVKKLAISSFNNVLRSQASWYKATVSVADFDNQGPVQPMGQAQQLTDETYRPHGGTPLYDTIAATILQVEKELGNPKDVIITIVTDGGECTSREWRDPAKLRSLIERKMAEGWQFLYCYCGPAYGESITGQAEKIGIPADCAASITDIKTLFSKVDGLLTSYRQGDLKRLTFAGSSQDQEAK